MEAYYCFWFGHFQLVQRCMWTLAVLFWSGGLTTFYFLYSRNLSLDAHLLAEKFLSSGDQRSYRQGFLAILPATLRYCNRSRTAASSTRKAKSRLFSTGFMRILCDLVKVSIFHASERPIQAPMLAAYLVLTLTAPIVC